MHPKNGTFQPLLVVILNGEYANNLFMKTIF